ncbi:MAG TPA: hypothetical protein VNV43_12285 [Candidatus Acidoferrales bacterium]|nr:hypothetical protein [Candidatus Acidoferrales bacterium]
MRKLKVLRPKCWNSSFSSSSSSSSSSACFICMHLQLKVQLFPNLPLILRLEFWMLEEQVEIPAVREIMKISRPVVTAGCMVIAFLGFLLLARNNQATAESEALARALTLQIDSHSSRIASVLATMAPADTNSIQDAIYDELRKSPSTSLILRSDVTVEKGPDGRLKCLVDTSRYGVAPRIIFQTAP